jgi:hypothetical protein
MQFTTATLATILPLLALAAPNNPRSAPVSMAADGAQWTIRSAKRVCNAADTSCKWSFGIDTDGDGPGAPVACAYEVKAANANTPASQSPETGVTCGPFTVTSGWSGQFGPGNGFTTLSVVDWQKKLIAWPAYSDRDLANGVVVSPDRSFAVQKLT